MSYGGDESGSSVGIRGGKVVETLVVVEYVRTVAAESVCFYALVSEVVCRGGGFSVVQWW